MTQFVRVVDMASRGDSWCCHITSKGVLFQESDRYGPPRATYLFIIFSQPLGVPLGIRGTRGSRSWRGGAPLRAFPVSPHISRTAFLVPPYIDKGGWGAQENKANMEAVLAKAVADQRQGGSSGLTWGLRLRPHSLHFPAPLLDSHRWIEMFWGKMWNCRCDGHSFAKLGDAIARVCFYFTSGPPSGDEYNG